MIRLTDYPLVFFAISLVVLSAAAMLGIRMAPRIAEVREDFSVILTATLTLLGLLLGFTFSMSVGRYDQRRQCEAEEANAIGTEYVRAELLPDTAEIRGLLRDYLDQRILFYGTHDEERQKQIAAATAGLQSSLWKNVKDASLAQQTPIVALAVSGMNDVLNTQSYTQAAWLNRIPVEAWSLLAFIATCATLMVGMSVRHGRSFSPLILIFCVVVSVSLLLIADIDSPRNGLIHVRPLNLMDLAASLRP